ncbi:MAG: S-adenosyl-l-methionine hydroxide adenosyltransferase family protein [Oscillospiraceae bacterium]
MAENALVFQSDFGLTDGAVCAMYGVSLSVDENLHIFNLTHDITPYNIWEASYRLYQSVEYWPRGTVFVSVVDPGVGSSRKSVVAKTKSGQFIVTPDNGTLTHIKKNIGIEAVREIDETRHRRKNTEYSYTFHGRDVYANTGAKLAAGKITFEEVGEELPVEKILELECGEVTVSDCAVTGCVDILDVRFGSLWTNVPREEFKKIGAEFGDKIEVEIYNNSTLVYSNAIVYGHSFADVRIGEPIIYVNSLYCMAVAINQGSFAKAYSIGTGSHWKIAFRKLP